MYEILKLVYLNIKISREGCGILFVQTWLVQVVRKIKSTILQMSTFVSRYWFRGITTRWQDLDTAWIKITLFSFECRLIPIISNPSKETNPFNKNFFCTTSCLHSSSDTKVNRVYIGYLYMEPQHLKNFINNVQTIVKLLLLKCIVQYTTNDF